MYAGGRGHGVDGINHTMFVYCPSTDLIVLVCSLEPVPDTLIGEENYKGCAPISTRYGEVGIGDVKPHKNYFGCTPLLSSMLQAIRGFRKF